MVNMGTVWDRTTEFLTDNLGAVLPIALLTMFVPQSISGVVQQAGAAVSQILSQGLSLVLLLPILWGQLAIVALAIDPDAGRGAAQSVATKRFGPAIVAMLILFVAVMILAAPVLIALTMSGVDLSGSPAAQPMLSPGLRIFLGVYFFVWLAAMIFVSIRLSALLFAIVIVEGGVVSALRRSYAVSGGIWLKMLGVYFLFAVVFIVAYLAVTLVFGALFQFIAPGAGPFGIGAIVVAILGGLINTAYYVIVSTFSAKLYRASVAARAA